LSFNPPVICNFCWNVFLILSNVINAFHFSCRTFRDIKTLPESPLAHWLRRARKLGSLLLAAKSASIKRGSKISCAELHFVPVLHSLLRRSSIQNHCFCRILQNCSHLSTILWINANLIN
jgi:hypothetical protein